MHWFLMEREHLSYFTVANLGQGRKGQMLIQIKTATTYNDIILQIIDRSYKEELI